MKPLEIQTIAVVAHLDQDEPGFLPRAQRDQARLALTATHPFRGEFNPVGHGVPNQMQ